ncbi:glycosyl hydrolase family 18 protein [Mucilaginibacter polytrichastri]|uniref:glycosyl hydrolase family 18 protein n=1 Tax=Mucilaginibacter polytrichastri TaxID=1302689 RepID=UPI0015C57941|nr:glycosyl hydrolase family 18 protein [Mucilaginibacter polytrichastri]
MSPTEHMAGNYAPIDTAKTVGLLKKLSNALKFRKNSLTKEKKRVIDIIGQVLRDSSITTTKDLGDLKNDLTASNKMQFDSLMKLIQEIKAQKPQKIEVLVPADGTKVDPNTPPEPVSDPNTKYINALIDKLVPILKDNKEIEQQKEAKQKKLKLLRSIYNHPSVFRDTINDSTAVDYTVKIRQKANVWGFYEYGTNTANFDFKVLNTLDYFAYFLNGKTGYSKNFTGWDSLEVIKDVQYARNKVILSVFNDDAINTAAFLTNEEAQNNMVNSTLNLLSSRNADGVNITFRNLNKKLSGNFVRFITRLNKAYKSGKKQYSVNITIPAFDQGHAYDLNKLDSLTDNFLIDFSVRTTTKFGPIAPLHQESDYSIESCVSRYLNSVVPPYKFILLLPYNGTLWKTNIKTGVNTFNRYIPYSEIRSKYQFSPVEFDKVAASSKIELKDANGIVNGAIWYDDENTLDEKYDFVLQNGLGGVAVSPLGADEGYGELWDALASKFLKIDTVISARINLKHATKLSGWEYIKSTLQVYYRVLEHPCLPENPDNRLIMYFNIFWVILTLATAVILIYCLKNSGDTWQWKKPVIITLICEVNILVITIFMWLYLADSIPWFGAGSGNNCIDMPFSKLLIIIVSGILLGTAVMRFLIFPAIKKDDTP